MSLLCWLSALLCWPRENFPFSITWEDICVCLLMLCFTAYSKTWLIFLYSPLKHNSLNFKLKKKFWKPISTYRCSNMAYITPLPHPPPACDPDFLSNPVSPTFCFVFHALGGKGNLWQFLMDIMLLPAPVCLPRLCPLPQMPWTAQWALLPLLHPRHFAQDWINYPSSVFPVPTSVITSIPYYYNYLLYFYLLPPPPQECGLQKCRDWS